MSGRRLTVPDVALQLGVSVSTAHRISHRIGVRHTRKGMARWTAADVAKAAGYRAAGSRLPARLELDRTPYLYRHLEAMRLRGLRPTTIEQRERAIRRMRRATGRDLLDMSEDEVAAFYSQRLAHLTPGARASELKHLRGFARWAVRERLIASDPTIRIDLPRQHRRLPRPIPEPRLIAALAAADADVRVALALAAYAGLRAGEIARLDWRHVMDELPEPTIFVADGKGGHQRYVPIHPMVAAALQAVPRSVAGPLLLRRDGRSGHWHLDRAVLTNLELGRRQAVTVDELAAFAIVFGVQPDRLLLSDEAAGLEQAQQLIREWDLAQEEWLRARAIADAQWNRLSGFIRSFPDLQPGIRDQLRQSASIKRAAGDSSNLDKAAEAYIAQALSEGEGEPA
jgi:integrase